jgi:hypothetical protein
MSRVLNEEFIVFAPGDSKYTALVVPEKYEKVAIGVAVYPIVKKMMSAATNGKPPQSAFAPLAVAGYITTP